MKQLQSQQPSESSKSVDIFSEVMEGIQPRHVMLYGRGVASSNLKVKQTIRESSMIGRIINFKS